MNKKALEVITGYIDQKGNKYCKDCGFKKYFKSEEKLSPLYNGSGTCSMCRNSFGKKKSSMNEELITYAKDLKDSFNQEELKFIFNACFNKDAQQKYIEKLLKWDEDLEAEKMSLMRNTDQESMDRINEIEKLIQTNRQRIDNIYKR